MNKNTLTLTILGLILVVTFVAGIFRVLNKPQNSLAPSAVGLRGHTKVTRSLSTHQKTRLENLLLQIPAHHPHTLSDVQSINRLNRETEK